MLQQDIDPQETREWLEALDAVVEHDGPGRAQHLLERVVGHAQLTGAAPAPAGTTPYINTIPPQHEPEYPVDEELERRVRSLMRWNAIAMVLKANKESSELGGHIASYQSAAVLYEIGFNHFWRAPVRQPRRRPRLHAGPLVAGHLRSRVPRGAADRGAAGGLPTGGLAQRAAVVPASVADARLLAVPDRLDGARADHGHLPGPLHEVPRRAASVADTAGRKVWAFLGDGETDEPESLGAISLAGRERLDNLIFVINCNLQRLDGPVRGNGKIIQELETVFRGSGWNVIKVVWGSRWDELLARDHDGLLLARMEEAVDGDYQTYKSRDGAYVREHFFGTSPELRAMVADMSDEEVWALNRGGLDPRKVYAAYKAAVEHTGQPTVILAKTIKGYGMGEAGEGQNITHQQKKMTEHALLAFRDRFGLPLSDEQVRDMSLYRPPEDSPEMTFLRERRAALGGSLPARRRRPMSCPCPSCRPSSPSSTGTGDREVSTTMAFVRVLSTLLRDKRIGRHVVPIVPDESRTFGMEGMFRQLGIFSQVGQLYTPEDSEQLMFYREDKKGQVLQEGINEAGAFSSWIAASTSYSNHGVPMIPFYIFYSMFGFQRIGDLAWAAGDSRARGFLLGGTAGRTTLNGEGLQHEDGHSHLLSATIPNCVSYDPTYGYEVAVIVQEGLRRMLAEQDDVFYYLTLMNENYRHPAMPEGAPGGHPARHVPPGAGRAVRGLTAGAAAGLGHDPARGARRGRPAARRLGRVGRRLQRHELHRAAARGDGGRALEHPASRRGAAARLGGEHPGGRRRARGGGDGLHARVRRPDPAVGAMRPTVCWAPTASAAATTARRCGPSSRWTAITSRWRR